MFSKVELEAVACSDGILCFCEFIYKTKGTAY